MTGLVGTAGPVGTAITRRSGDLEAPAPAPAIPPRQRRTRRYAVCPPTFFDVRVRVNPWMHPEVPVDRTRALAQWQDLVDTYRWLGHQVDVVEPAADLDDMVFAANSAFVHRGRALLARMRDPHRRAESTTWGRWLRDQGIEVVEAEHVFEGEGDVVLVGETLVVADGPRSVPAAREQLRRVFPWLDVLGVRLVDPRWYHLDTAMFALDETTIAWHPPAFASASRAAIRARWPEAIELTLADALAFGANSVSDGRDVVVPAAATGLVERLAEHGFTPHPVDLSELLLSGGAVKCCTLEVHP